MKISSVLLSLCLACLSLNAAAETISMASKVPYAEDSKIRRNVLNECTELGTKLSAFTQQFSKKLKNEIVLADSISTNSEGMVLELHITDAVSGGNGFIGHQKYVGVSGTLYKDGKRVAGFTGGRYSGGGAFGGYKGSCSVLGRCTKALGKDIANWLNSPVDEASLGDG